MSAEAAAISIAAVLFVASLIRSAFGFGEALVAVPLLALVIPVSVAAPLAVLASITVACIALIQDWRKVHIRSATSLVLSTMLGIPLGLMLLKAGAEPVVKGVLACVILAFSAYVLFSGKQRELDHDRFAWLFGFSAGVLGGAYGMNGPPLVVYGSLRRWSPQYFRATLQGYFLPASLVGLWGYQFAGLWTAEVNRLYLLSLPLVVLATFIGRAINHRIAADRFLPCVHAGLIVAAIVLLLQAIGGPGFREGTGSTDRSDPQGMTRMSPQKPGQSWAAAITRP